MNNFKVVQYSLSYLQHFMIVDKNQFTGRSFWKISISLSFFKQSQIRDIMIWFMEKKKYL